MAMNEVVDEIPRREFTVSSFLSNPTGDAGTNTQARKLVLTDMEKKLYGLESMGKLFKPQFFKAGTSLFAKVTVPSETFDTFGYDVIIEFEEYSSDTTTLNSNLIRFFSNSPSFVYTYAHVFKEFGILVEPLIKRYPTAVFKEIPDTRNPSFMTFYEKSITMALLYLRNHDLLSKRKYSSMIKNIPLAKLKDYVAASEDKELEYKMHQQAEAKHRKAEKEKRKLERDVADKAKKDSKLPKSSKMQKSVNSKVSNKVTGRTVGKVNNRVDNKVKNKVK